MLRTEPLNAVLRRLLDLSGALAGLVILSPLLLSLAVRIKRYDGGPVFYRALRVGKHGKLFRLYKFRTMVVNADRLGAGITIQGDTRITPVGHWLRQRKLDELPQLLNVLRGEMSLVGPRPEDPRYVQLYTPEQRGILAACPGMTSPASLAYRDEEQQLSGDTWQQIYIHEIMPAKLAIDLAYLKRQTAWTDLHLILTTCLTVFR